MKQKDSKNNAKTAQRKSSNAVSPEAISGIKAAIPGSFGIVGAIAQRAKVSRTTVCNARRQDEEIDSMIKEENENFGDVAETALMKGIREGNQAMIIFALRTRFRERGYTESMAHNVSGAITHVHRKELDAAMATEEGQEAIGKLANILLEHHEKLCKEEDERQ